MPSTVIRSFDYDPVNRRLNVRLVSGRGYSYLGVPPEVATAMRLSFAKGEFFNVHIRPNYRFERLADLDVE
ncbi:MAG TPA: KTSC domain-containing protein [Phenylobacterium sp.]